MLEQENMKKKIEMPVFYTSPTWAVFDKAAKLVQNMCTWPLEVAFYDKALDATYDQEADNVYNKLEDFSQRYAWNFYLLSFRWDLYMKPSHIKRAEKAINIHPWSVDQRGIWGYFKSAYESYLTWKETIKWWVTTHYMNEIYDLGHIIESREIDIKPQTDLVKNRVFWWIELKTKVDELSLLALEKLLWYLSDDTLPSSDLDREGTLFLSKQVIPFIRKGLNNEKWNALMTELKVIDEWDTLEIYSKLFGHRMSYDT